MYFMNLDISSEILGDRKTIHNGAVGLIFCWNGGHTCNVYDEQGNSVDTFSFGDFKDNKASFGEFEKAVQRYLDNMEDEGWLW